MSSNRLGLNSDNGWRRLHSVGRRVTFRSDFRMTSRGAWYYEQSKARYLRRPDVYPPDGLLTGCIGRIDSFKIYESAPSVQTE